MSQWGFYFDQTRCVGCNACALACKCWNDDRRGDYKINSDPMNPNTDWYSSGTYVVDINEMDNKSFYLNSEGETNFEQNRKYYMKEDWRRVNSNERAFPYSLQFTSVACNHCTNPACVAACPMGIIYKEESHGIVLVNNDTCISCGSCKEACPWGAPQFYAPNFSQYGLDDPTRPRMTKCTLCLDRIKEGLKPACVAACINRALDAGPVDELRAKWASAGKSVVEYTQMPNEDFASSSGIEPNIIFVKK
ncbi:4Fe-4S dicluster domain-containing protein [Geovibrio thiophilus]|uniref:4Fe-4S dicluster domain-containing protein n=1 Tax=Geovibrio thiophilus TaxID=139438 RepID=A0A410K0Y3_9BACT|nr:4Fe-4S dicluster domain-containing protein [Geovibrio thiophilus]QAR34011.1 4Fe-4S dicluster domain-containing protein [Geovibrio thiophilus]